MPRFKDRDNFFSFIRSSISSRIVPCGTLLLILALFIPTLSYSRLPPVDPRDSYIRKTLTLDVGFKYTSHSTQHGDYDSGRSWTFGESYRIKLRGNIIDPRLIIYDSYSYYNIDRRSSGSISSSFGLGVSSTIFRKFKYPVSVYENRAYSGSTIRDTFGARSFLDFRRLPDTNLTATYSRVKNDINTTLNSYYNVRMDKDIGPTVNSLTYSYNISDNGSTNATLGIQNGTTLSRATRLSASMSHHKSTPTDVNSASTNGAGFTMSLSSKTDANFLQNHSYAIFSSNVNSPDGDSHVEGQSYAGGWSFRLFDLFTTGGGISVSEFESTSVTSDDKNENLFANWTLGHSFSNGLNLSANSIYSRSKSDTVSIATSESSREYFTANMGISYSREIREADFSSSYHIGYIEELSLPDNGGGTGISNSLALSLSNINYKRVNFVSRYSASRVDNITGKIWSSNQGFSLSATPGYWKQYGHFSSAYTFSSVDDWHSAGPTSSHTLGLNANSKSFRNTSGSASQYFTISRSPYLSDESSKSSSSSISISHLRHIYGGPLSLSMTYNIKKSEDGSAVSESSTRRATAGYKRRLLRRITWRSNFSYYKATDLDAGESSSGTNLSNSFIYYVRSWSINASHILSTYSSDFSEATYEQKLMVNVRRSFGRVF